MTKIPNDTTAANDASEDSKQLPDDMHLDELEQAIWQDSALDEALQRIETDTLKSTEKALPVWWPAVAACFLMVICGLIFVNGTSSGSGVEPVQLLSYQSEIAEPKVINLSDGSEVSLNADTQLSVSLSKSQRNVSLKQGEAYFDVESDRERPFIIGTQWGDIQVVGTEFNVDQTARGVEVSVYEGEVLVTTHSGDSTMLKAGESALLSVGELNVSSFQLAKNGVDWMSGQLQVNGHSIQYVVDQLNRYSEQTVYLAPDVSDVQITGAFELQHIPQSLELLAELSGLSLTHIQGIYYLSPTQ